MLSYHFRYSQENIEHVRRAIKMEATLTLQSDIVDIAKDRHLWKYLELIGQHILIESGELNPVWLMTIYTGYAYESNKAIFLFNRQF
jgi:hypothetical protein